MSLLPYFKWYPADAETDEFYSSLTDEELGFFHRCLNKSWINNGLPPDLGNLAAVMGYSRRRKTFARIWRKVVSGFVLKDGKIKNSRQEKERDSAISKSLKSTESIKARYERSSDEVRTNHHARYESESACVSGSSSEVKKETSLREISKYTAIWFYEQHERWYSQYWCKRAKISSFKAFEKRVKQLVKAGNSHEGSVEFLIERTQFDRLRFEGTADWEFRGGLYPATWLNGERWNDDGPRIIKPSRQERRAGCPPCPACGCNPCAPNCRAAALAVAR